jgi:anaerobic selenocysteine-containing dehydrogenase
MRRADRETQRKQYTDSGETFYPGPSRGHLAAYPPKERWDDWTELDSRAWPRRVERHYSLVPTTCFNCESACGLLAYIDKVTGEVQKFEGNPEHPGSRGRNCAKGPATLNQVTDPDRILHPMKRTGKRGEGKWQRTSWNEALDTLATRIRNAIVENRKHEIMYHVGRPGEDGFTERILAAWGIDGHNSHTNICSSGSREGYQLWMGLDRPSPDHANAKVILLISAHLESGHYFNPHAQRVIDGKASGAKLIVFDTRLSHTATHADYWVAPYPGSETAMLLAIANYLIQNDLYNRDFVEKWWNWREFGATDFADFESRIKEIYRQYTFEFAAEESGVDAKVIEERSERTPVFASLTGCPIWCPAFSASTGGVPDLVIPVFSSGDPSTSSCSP